MESKIFKSPLIKTSGRRISSSSISSSGSKGDVTSVLTETNRILVEIQKQLSLDFAMRAAEEKKEKRDNKISESRKRFKKEESVLEKTSKKIRKSVGKASEKIVSPAVNIFDKILEFIGIVGAGIAVNAAFKWFEDEENRKKLVKFFNILKENWQLVAKILGTLVAGGVILKATGAILTIGKVLAILSSPLVIGVLSGAALLYAAHRASREGIVGGPGFVEAHDVLDASLKTAGITNDGKYEKDPNKELSDAHKRLYKDVQVKRAQLYTLKSQQDNEADAAGNKVGKGTPLGQGTYSNELAYEQARGVVLKKYSNLARDLVGLPQRAMGGPVSSGKAYLVGERGPEIFAPNVDGSIINNMRTEKIYQMISSDIEGDIDFIELPPITNKIPPPNVPSLEQATDVPMISSTNSADPYLQVSPKLYGVMV